MVMVIGEAGCIAFAAIGMFARSVVAIVTGVVAGGSVLLAGLIISRVFKLDNLPTFETDGSTRLRVFSKGHDVTITPRDVRSVAEEWEKTIVKTSDGTVVVIPAHTRGYAELTRLVTSWQSRQ